MKQLRRIIKFLFEFALGIWLLLLSGGAFTFLPQELPHFDYLPEIDRLIDSGSYQEAAALTGDILDTGEYDPAILRQLESRKNYCTQTLKSHPAGDFVRGFVTGDSSTVWSGSGSIAGDFLIWGDIRDLAFQGLKYLTGQETDPVLVSLSALGLALEITPAADILSSILKSLRKAGKLPGFIVKSIVSPGGKKLYDRLAELFKSTGRGRFKAVLLQAGSTGDLDTLVLAAKTDPARLHLAMYSAGPETLHALKNAPDAAGRKRILQLAPKGKTGLKLLRRHRLFGLAKITASGRLNRFFRQLALAHPGFRYLLLGAGAFLVILGCVDAGKSFFSARKSADNL